MKWSEIGDTLAGEGVFGAMTKYKFTKGPWEFNHKYGYDAVCATENNKVTAVLFTLESEDLKDIGEEKDKTNKEINAEIIANGRLCAAAPDMYEALGEQCKSCSAVGDYCLNVCSVGKALRKARGEE